MGEVCLGETSRLVRRQKFVKAGGCVGMKGVKQDSQVEITKGRKEEQVRKHCIYATLPPCVLAPGMRTRAGRKLGIWA